jgi:hypothetical protein
VNKIILSAVILMTLTFTSKAQDGYFQEGEFGFSVGAAHYFGDLNTRSGLNRPKPALGIFFKKQFGNYVGLRVSGHYAQVGYSDIYSKNEYQKLRNLSFNSNIYEFAVQGDFNFYKYVPNNMEYNFTPYITLGLGLFGFDPTAIDDNGDKQYLRTMHTEGQTGDYQTMKICIPFGLGVKYSVNSKVNLSFEITHRFTTTDYLDDVSTTYVGLYNPDGSKNISTGFWGPDPNSNNYILTPAGQLQDRSEGQILGVAGRQRGWSKQKDQYVIAEIGLSFNIGTYRCPTAF